MKHINLGKCIKRPVFFIGFFAMFTALVIMIAGCSRDKSSSPTLTEEQQLDELYVELFNPPPGEVFSIAVSDSATIEMSIQSGLADTARYTIDGLSNTIVCPANLVSTPAALQMRCERLMFVRGTDSSRTALYYDCSPDGITFNDSLVVDVDSVYFNNSPNSNVVKLYVYSELDQRWLHYDNSQKAARVVFYLTHFSKYAISD